MNLPISRTAPRPLSELRAELDHLIEANETARLLVRETCATLINTLNLHLDQTDAQIRRLIGEIERRR